MPCSLVIPGASYRGEGSVQILGCLLLQEALTASAPPSGIAVLLSDTSSASQGPTNTVSIPLALLFTPWGPADMFSLPSTITVIAPVRPSQVFFFFFSLSKLP